MNERLKELAEQAGFSFNYGSDLHTTIERFADLVRQDERRVYVRSFMELQHAAIEETRLEEREACAVLVEGGNHVHPKAPDVVWAKTVAKLIRARGEK